MNLKDHVRIAHQVPVLFPVMMRWTALRRRVHDHGSLASYGFNCDRRALPEEPAMGLVCPRFEMDSEL